MDIFNLNEEEFNKIGVELENSDDISNLTKDSDEKENEDSKEQPSDSFGSENVSDDTINETSSLENELENEEAQEKELSDSTVDNEITSSETDSVPDYKQFYEEITKPIKVNGVELTFNDPNEIRSLASKGTDYTRKTQELAAQRRYIETLQNNGLLSDDKLNVLVGAAKGDKAALKQLIKDNNLSSEDLFDSYGGYGDDEEEKPEEIPSYVEPAELYNFKSTIKDISTKEGGNELLQNLREWDSQSQNWVIENPTILNEMYDHKETGLYDKLNTEINRLRVLGQVPPEIPYLVLYKDLLGKVNPSEINGASKEPIATGKGQPNGIHKPNPLASRASTPRGSMGVKPTKKPIDIFSLSDEEFKAKEKEILKMIGE